MKSHCWRERSTRSLAVLLLLCSGAFAGDHLKLNPKLDYTSDSYDGPLITGDHMQDGLKPGMPNYIIIYGERCFNSKRQARRTVDLYARYKGRINFVVVDMDLKLSPQQQKLMETYYGGYIPHVVVLDGAGRVVHNDSGEVEETRMEAILAKVLAK